MLLPPQNGGAVCRTLSDTQLKNFSKLNISDLTLDLSLPDSTNSKREWGTQRKTSQGKLTLKRLPSIPKKKYNTSYSA